MKKKWFSYKAEKNLQEDVRLATILINLVLIPKEDRQRIFDDCKSRRVSLEDIYNILFVISFKFKFWYSLKKKQKIFMNAYNTFTLEPKDMEG